MNRLPDWTVGFGFRPFSGYRSGCVYLPECLIRFGPNFHLLAGWSSMELSIDWGLKKGRVLEGETSWEHSWRIRWPRPPVRLIWVREFSRAAAWTGRVRRCIGFEYGLGARRVVYFRR